MKHISTTRRGFVRALPALGTAVLAVTPGVLIAQEKEKKKEEGVSTNEDLMREHGILTRVLLAYDEIIRRIEGLASNGTPTHLFRVRETKALSDSDSSCFARAKE